MSYATDFHLLDDQGTTQSSGFNQQFKKNLATSVAFHVLVFIVLLSIRVPPIHDRPLASYQIELVDLSEPKAVPASVSSTPKKSVAKKSVPVPAPVSKSVPAPPPIQTPPVVQVPQERLAESFAGALDQVALPKARPLATSQQPSSVPPSTIPEAPPAPDQPLNLQSPPSVPQLTTRERPSLGSKTEAPASKMAASLAKSLQQAVESVPIPPTTHRSAENVPSESKAGSPKSSKMKESLSASRGITLPPEAPKLAATTPVEKFPDRPSERVKKAPLSEALQQAVRSVVIPHMKASEGAKPKVPPVVPHQPAVQEKTAMPKMILPPQAPKLATVEAPVRPANQTTPDQVSQSVSPDHDELGAKIAKLTIPDVDVSQPHETLNDNPSNPVKTKTHLKISGSSPDGNPYWGRVWAKIDQEWIAPPVNVHQGNLLRVILEFRLERTGTVNNLRVEQTSGNEYFDLAAKRAVLTAAPLPGFPQDMTERHFTLQFQFTVNER